MTDHRRIPPKSNLVKQWILLVLLREHGEALNSYTMKKPHPGMVENIAIAALMGSPLANFFLYFSTSCALETSYSSSRVTYSWKAGLGRHG